MNGLDIHCDGGGNVLALKIIQLVQPKQSIDTAPLVYRFFHEVTETKAGQDTYKIEVDGFINDKGEVPDALPELQLNNHYFHVFINGMLQMDDNFSYTAGELGIGSLIISIPEGSTLYEQNPVVLEIVNFYPRM